MNRYKTTVFAAALSLGAMTGGQSSALAQTFQNYGCADGTQFIVAFYPYDTRAYLQLDGGEVRLTKRVALSGSRYSGRGVTLRITAAGTTIKHAKRPVTTCDLK